MGYPDCAVESAACHLGGVGGPVSGRGALPGDGNRDVDAEHPGEHCGRQQLCGELEQRAAERARPE